jgi:pyruvate oxidase
MHQKQVVSIVGDGGLAMTLAELLTATHHKLNIIVILFNNGTLQMEKDKMLMNGYKFEGVNLTNPNFVQVAKACGWNAYRINSYEQLKDTMNIAFTSKNPVLIDVNTAPIPHPDFVG